MKAEHVHHVPARTGFWNNLQNAVYIAWCKQNGEEEKLTFLFLLALEFSEKLLFARLHSHGCHRSGNGQGRKIRHGQGNIREFYSGSGKIGILKKSQGKLKL